MSTNYRQLSFWFDSLVTDGVDDLTPRPALMKDATVDVCIVGGGLTGLWTAYYLKKADPSLRIAVLEKHIAGFGASGRNGGWCSALFPSSATAIERRLGRPAALAQRQAMIDTVAEVARVTELEGIDCDFKTGGTVMFARGDVQEKSARAELVEAERLGVDPFEYWEPDAVNARFGIAGMAARGTEPMPGTSNGALFDPNCARLHPGKLVRGLARIVEALGVEIYEQTEVTDWFARRVRFRGTSPSGKITVGRVATEHVVIATEGYGSQLPRVGRYILPLYSLMIATEPLSDAVWDDIGIEHGQTFSDFRHLLVYGQRTADNRFAFGGRGARYHWGSAIQPSFDRDPKVFAHLKRTLGELFPAAAHATLTHSWGGPLGVSRDWCATASHNPKTGVSLAGGYVGDGLSTTNLAGRSLSDLIRGEKTPLTALPWVNHRSPRWEPEPLRFVGSNLGLVGMEAADLEESLTRRPSIAARLMSGLTGG